MAGVTPQGFVAKTVQDLVSDLNGVWRGVFGNAVNVDPRSRHGQMIASLASSLSEVWQLGEAIAGVFANPSGILLDYIAALTGTTRLAATASKVTLALTGTPGTIVAAGKIAGVTGTTAQFALTAQATIGPIFGWGNGDIVSAGDRRSNFGNIYQYSQGGSCADDGTGPSGTGSGIVDGSAVCFFIGTGTGAIDAPAACTVTGPVQGYSGTINVISTPVGGWNGVYNVLDAVPGTNLETDPQLRTRRATEAAGQGRTPLPAMRAQLLKVAGVTSVVIFENVTNNTVDTSPPHSIEVLVEGGADADIAAAIFANRCGALTTSGTSSQTVVDSEGIAHVISFSRPTELDLYTAITVVVDPNAFPIDGLTQCTDTIATAGNALGQGRDVYGFGLAAALFAKDEDGNLLIPGVLSIAVATVGTVNPPVATSVSVSIRQIPTFDTSRTFITIVPGSV